jgi:hypothetical protein
VCLAVKLDNKNTVGVIRIFLVASVGVLLAACDPKGAHTSAAGLIVPEVPKVADAGLQQRLHTLRAVVNEYGKLALPAAGSEEKTSQRLELLRQGFEDLRRKCLDELDAAGPDASAVKEFLQACATAIDAGQR